VSTDLISRAELSPSPEQQNVVMSRVSRPEHAPKRRQLLYHEVFARGHEGWTAGKDKEDGSFNRNILGHRGEALPATWHAGGGRSGSYISSESPWYFDSNHGEFMWFYMPFIGPREDAWSGRNADLRDAVVRITLRGHNLDLKGTKLYFWIQGHGGPHPTRSLYNPGDPVYNWALTSQSIRQELTDGKWHSVELRLFNDEDKWSQMGLLSRGLPRKIVVEQSLTAATGKLDHLLNRHHINIGFILGGVDCNAPPSGGIDLDSIRVATGV